MLLGTSLLLALVLSRPATGAPGEDFLRAERALQSGRLEEARELMVTLRDYPLHPYLELDLARRQLAMLSDEDVAALLRRHADVPASLRLRREWLERLVREGRWDTIAAHPGSDDHAPSACLTAEAMWRTGRDEEAWQRVSALWPTGRSLPDVCDRVLDAWRAAGQLGDDQAWTRARLAMDRGNVSLARYLARYLGPDHDSLLRRWLALRGAPGGLVEFAREGRLEEPERRHVLLHVFSRTARRNVEEGIALWTSLAHVELPEELGAEMKEVVGIELAEARDPRARDWLAQARTVPGLVARAVTGIREGRWKSTIDAISSMPPAEARRERWRYWAGRARELEGDAGGRDRLAEVAGERSYYGFMAADRLGLPYALGHEPIDAPAQTMQAVAARPPMQRAQAWWALGRGEEARREWNRLLNSLDTPDILAATELVHRWGWHSAAIRGAAAAAYWSDLDVRFPAPYPDSVKEAARGSGLRPSRIYAVARQESAFMVDIRSSAGAVGLMQLLPATARHVARKARMPRPGIRALLDPATNLSLGSIYLANLEARYSGHPVLASAAYNAGPGRVARWRKTQDRISSEIWVETIPFRETRRYVRGVLAYQAIYARRLGEEGVRLKDLMPAVTPG